MGSCPSTLKVIAKHHFFFRRAKMRAVET
jgi:hypothetical protein